MNVYDLYVAVDWSGARGPKLPGLQVACCTSGQGTPRLVCNPAGGAWSRDAFAKWLIKTTRTKKVLCGIDFSFGLPFSDQHSYFPGLVGAPQRMSALWHLIERVCRADSGFYGGRFIANPPYSNYFLGPGKWRGLWYDRWPARLRTVDRLCAAKSKLGRPESVFKAVGAKQVALGSFAGMRFLHNISLTVPSIKIWPLQMPAEDSSLLMEIYPSMFLGLLGRPLRKVREVDTLNEVLTEYGSRPVRRALFRGPKGNLDDKTDALLSAAAVRSLSGNDAYWNPSACRRGVGGREGWIYGVL